jgi:hypothetical protein
LGTPFPVSSDAEIWAAIQAYPAGRLSDIVRDSDPGRNNIPLAIKYVSVESASFTKNAWRASLTFRLQSATPGALEHTWRL